MNKKKLIIGLIVAVFLIGIVVSNVTTSTKAVGEAKKPLGETGNSKILVEIRGAVKYPNIYAVDANARVNDIISLAGGLESTANINDINLLEKVYDSMLIQINSQDNQEINIVSNNKISLNKATLKELMSLTGIGEAKAVAIINYRNTKNFSSIEEIKNVSGISENIFTKIKDFICL